MDSEIVIHKREVYNILNFFSDMGGASKTIFFLFVFIVGPISEYSFKVNSFQRLYLSQKNSSKTNKRSKNKKRVVRVPPPRRPKRRLWLSARHSRFCARSCWEWMSRTCSPGWTRMGTGQSRPLSSSTRF